MKPWSQSVMFDSHAHVISDDLERYPPAPLRGVLRQGSLDDPMTAERLLGVMDTHGIERAVLVQRAHVYGYDNSYVVDSARRHPARFAAVIVIDALAPDAASQVEKWVVKRGACGVRLTEPQRDADTDWFNSPAADRVWSACAAAGASISIQLYQWNRAKCLPQLLQVLRRFSTVPVIVEHASNFTETSVAPDHGCDAVLTALAAEAQVHLKLTTINLARMASNAVEPALVIRKLLAVFGAARLMWGSDIGQSPQPYAQMVALMRDAAGALRETDRAWLFRDCAAKVFRTTSKPVKFVEQE